MALRGPYNNKTHPIVLQIAQLIYESRKEHLLFHFIWAPSHKGIDGNEHVDGIARDASSLAPEHDLPIFPQELLPLIKKEKINQWQNKWNTSDKGRLLHSYHPTVGKTPWFFNSKFSRDTITTISRLRFGHVTTNEHPHRINIKPSPLCACNNSIDTINHRLFHYHKIPLLKRAQLTNDLARLNPPISNISQILKSLHPEPIKILVKFIKENNIALWHIHNSLK